MTIELETARTATASRTTGNKFRIQLLGGFQVRGCEQEFSVTPASERLIAFLALERQPMRRIFAAGKLWPDVSEERALGNLRSTLWRLGQQQLGLVESEGALIYLARDVEVDVFEVIKLGRRLVQAGGAYTEDDLEPGRFHGELLPGWYDDWVVIERERLRQLCLHALEGIARALLQQERHAEAIDVAWMVLTSDPFRESAHKIIIQAYQAEGNRGSAMRHYTWCRDVLLAEMKSAPSRDLQMIGKALLAT
jgi:DNA-binding SARP family transcriptional activator